MRFTRTTQYQSTGIEPIRAPAFTGVAKIIGIVQTLAVQVR